jgi:hypothetical protein
VVTVDVDVVKAPTVTVTLDVIVECAVVVVVAATCHGNDQQKIHDVPYQGLHLHSP